MAVRVRASENFAMAIDCKAGISAVWSPTFDTGKLRVVCSDWCTTDDTERVLDKLERVRRVVETFGQAMIRRKA